MNRRRVNWKAVRTVVQVLAFLALCVYFLALTYPMKVSWPPDLLFQLDPLMHIYLAVTGNGVTSWLMLILAVVLLFLVSRIFCGWLCPLGAMLDFVSGVRGRIKLWNRSRLGMKHVADDAGKNPRKSKLPPYFDVYLLLALIVLAALGSPLIWLLDPIVYSFKLLTVALLPVIDGPLRAGFEVADGWFYRAEWWWPVQDGYNAAFTNQEPVYTDTVLIMLFALAIFGLEFWQKRFWCRYICPLGAMCRLTYKLHPLRRRVRPDCTYCLSCETHCHFGGTKEDDCVYCMECINACKPGAISFLPGGEFLKSGKPTELAEAEPEETREKATLSRRQVTVAMKERIADASKPDKISRRLMLQYAAGGLVAAPLVRLFDGRTETPVDFIRPPGVYDEDEFTELCIKCGQCLKVCLTNGLQPALTEAGLSALWTPRLISRLGYCEYNCNLCGQVCPSGAIPKLALEEKQRQVLGIAYFDEDRCIPYDVDSNCTVCEEHCPTPDKAIKMNVEQRIDEQGYHWELLRPYVVPELCIGCGICEWVCPVPGLAAVRVYRKVPGSAYASIYGEDETASADDPYGLGAYGEENSGGTKESDSEYPEDYGTGGDPYGLGN